MLWSKGWEATNLFGHLLSIPWAISCYTHQFTSNLIALSLRSASCVINSDADSKLNLDYQVLKLSEERRQYNPFIAIILIPVTLIMYWVYHINSGTSLYSRSKYLSLKGPIISTINTFKSLFSIRACKLQLYFKRLMRKPSLTITKLGCILMPLLASCI